MTTSAPNPVGPEPPVPATPNPRRTRRRTTVLTWGTTAVLFLLAVALIAIAANHAPAPPLTTARKLANVETIRVEPREHGEELVLPAKLQADRRAVISSELGGRLHAWRIEEGAKAEGGVVVAALDPEELKSQLAQLQAQHRSAQTATTVSERQHELAQVALRQAGKDATALEIEIEATEADLAFRQREYDRKEKLASSKITTQAEMEGAANNLTQAKLATSRAKDAVDRASIGVDSARVNVEQAEANVELSKARTAEAEQAIVRLGITLDKTEPRAPFSGTIEEHLVEPGEVVAPGQPLAHIYDLSHLRATVDVPDRYVPFLDAGNEAVADYVTMALPGAEQHVVAKVIVPGPPKLTGGTYAGVELDAEIARVSQAADPASNTFKVELRLRNPGEALKEGMIARARIQYLRYPHAIVIPLKAVQVSDVGPRVLVVEDRDGASFAMVRDIEPISISGDQLLVGGGLEPGDQLVVSGGKGVMHGEEVRVIKSDGVLRLAGLPGAGSTDGKKLIKVAEDYLAPEADSGKAP